MMMAFGFNAMQMVAHLDYGVSIGSIHFVDHEHICGARIRLSGVIGDLMTGPMRVGHDNLQIGI